MCALEIVSPQAYFHDLVCEAETSLKVKLDEHLQFYIVNLMADFINPSRIGITIDDIDESLAIRFQKALELAPEQSLKHLKNLGDVSLYLAGYFQDYFNRKVYDIDYVIAMGSTAYQRVSSIQNDRHFTSLYQQLAEQFNLLVEVIAQLAENLNLQKDTNLLATYERWARTQSKRLRRVLESEGIIPLNGSLDNEQ